MHGIEFRHLRYFVAVCDHRSFTRAAAALCVTQSTISKGMRELEDLLGTPLFFRHSNKVSPTMGGKHLLDYAQPVLELHHESLHEFRLTHGRAPYSLRIGTSISVDTRIFTSGLLLYKELFPASTLEPSTGASKQIFDSLREGTIDAALVTLPFRDSATRVVPLVRERMLLCMRTDNELAIDSAIEASQLRGRLNIFADPAVHLTAHLRLMEMLKEAKIALESLFFAASVEERLEMVQKGKGITLIREHQVLPTGLTARPFARLAWTVDTALLYQPSLRNPAVPIWAKHLARMLQRTPFHLATTATDTN